MPKVAAEYAKAELAQLPNISKEQTEHSFDNDPVSSESEVRIDSKGNWEFVFWKDWLHVLFDKKIVE